MKALSDHLRAIGVQVIGEEADHVTAYIAPERLDTSTYNRPVNRAAVDKIVLRGWHGELAGELVVNLRPDGTLIIVDGQHRWEAAKQLRRKYLKCMVIVLTLKQEEAIEREGKLFVLLGGNTLSKRLNPLHLFRARLAWSEPCATEIARIARECGFVISENALRGEIKAVAALDRIYGTNTQGDKRAELLSAVLRTIHESWVAGRALRVDDLSACLHLDILTGLAHFMRAYAGQFDTALLVRKLGKESPIVVRSRAAGSAKDLGPESAVALVIRNIYNRNQRSPLADLPNKKLNW